jgi:hypothetical protein
LVVATVDTALVVQAAHTMGMGKVKLHTVWLFPDPAGPVMMTSPPPQRSIRSIAACCSGSAYPPVTSSARPGNERGCGCGRNGEDEDAKEEDDEGAEEEDDEDEGGKEDGEEDEGEDEDAKEGEDKDAKEGEDEEEEEGEGEDDEEDG